MASTSTRTAAGTVFVFLIALAALVAANGAALYAWVGLWAFSGHQYGFAILAGSVWLLWQSRDRLRSTARAPDWRALLLIVPLALAVWLAYLLEVQLAELALFLISVAALVWALLGPAMLRATALPLGFMGLALPFWNFLQPLLQAITIRATGLALALTGVPANIDGSHIETAHGTIVVIATCSGLQFFQAGMTLGVLYASQVFRRLRNQLLAVAGFVLTAIVGNWIRVYALVFLGILTERQHFVLGWGVFMVLLTVLLWFGWRLQLREDRLPSRGAGGSSVQAPKVPAAPIRASLASVFIALVATGLLVLAPLLANRPVVAAPGVGLTLEPPAVLPPWSGPILPNVDWQPSFRGTDVQLTAEYRLGERSVVAYWGYYAYQSQRGGKAMSELNKAYDAPRWRPRDGGVTTYEQVHLTDGTRLEVLETRLENPQSGEQRVVWQWYRIAGCEAAGWLPAKLAQAAGLLHGRHDALVIALSAAAPDPGEARALLERFVTANVGALRRVTMGAPCGRPASGVAS